MGAKCAAHMYAEAYRHRLAHLGTKTLKSGVDVILRAPPSTPRMSGGL